MEKENCLSFRSSIDLFCWKKKKNYVHGRMNDLSPADGSHVTDERGRLNQQPTGGAADAADPARSMHGRLFVTCSQTNQIAVTRLRLRRFSKEFQRRPMKIINQIK